MRRFEEGEIVEAEMLSDGLPRWNFEQDRLLARSDLAVTGWDRGFVGDSDPLSFSVQFESMSFPWNWSQPEDDGFVVGGEGYVRHVEGA